MRYAAFFIPMCLCNNTGKFLNRIFCTAVYIRWKCFRAEHRKRGLWQVFFCCLHLLCKKTEAGEIVLLRFLFFCKNYSSLSSDTGDVTSVPKMAFPSSALASFSFQETPSFTRWKSAEAVMVSSFSSMVSRRSS